MGTVSSIVLLLTLIGHNMVSYNMVMLVGVVDLHVGRFADLHVGQSRNWVWD